MRQIDTIHFQSMRNSQICMIGCDIRTEGGFPHERLLFASRQYQLKEREARLLFGIPQRYPVGSCRIVITTGFFYDGGIFPPIPDFISDEQTLLFLQFVSTQFHITPLLDWLKDTAEEKEYACSLSSTHRLTYKYEQRIQMKGGAVLRKCKHLTSSICRSTPVLQNQSTTLLYSLHNYLMQLMAPYVVPDLLVNLQNQISLFQECKQQCSNVSLEDLHVPTLFRCNFNSLISFFNQCYFDFVNHPETVYPVSILSCWNRLIKDIHYVINKSVVANAALSSDTRSTLALSTDDTIGIVTFIILKAEHASCLPSHLLYVNAFSPMDLSSSPLGMVYGVMDTAVLWIMGHKPSSL
ncbi:hypothetical protein WA588_004566, partial [Blastocystis sp. NMH]